MVRPPADAGVGNPATFLRKAFDVATPSGREVLRISALGLYRAFINGKRVGDDLLTPGWTVYDKRLSFQTYEVGGLLQTGQNTIDIWLADGWYRSQMMWPQNPIYNTWGDQIGAIAELRATQPPMQRCWSRPTRAGTAACCRSLKIGHLFRRDLRRSDRGLAADARREAIALRHFRAGAARDRAGARARAARAGPEPAPMPRAGRSMISARTPAAMSPSRSGARPGAKVIVEHCRNPRPRRQFRQRNFRSAEARIEYVLKGERRRTYRPIFTFFGFRYARVTIEGKAEVTHIESVPISSDARADGKLQLRPIRWSTGWSRTPSGRSAPTSSRCRPIARSATSGWAGPATRRSSRRPPAICTTAEVFLRKWLRDVMADQRPDGAIAACLARPDALIPRTSCRASTARPAGATPSASCPWVLYEHYGDPASSTRRCRRWSAGSTSSGRSATGRSSGRRAAWGGRGFTFGDWLQPKGAERKAAADDRRRRRGDDLPLTFPRR